MLSFPAGTLLQKSLVLPVLFRGNGCVALSKPSGVPADEHPWNGSRANICAELRKRIAVGQASALALGLSRPATVFLPDAESSGLVLLADRDGNALDFWRNAAGSNRLIFEFLFLAKPVSGVSAEEKFSCELPVASHFSEPRAVISHKTGKKSETRFSRLEKFGNYELWRAETTFPRPHQIRLHARECGLPIVGDGLYGGVPAILNSAFGRKGRLNKGEERPLYAFPCLHLARISAAAGTVFSPDVSEISAPLPDGFDALLKKLRRRVF